MANTYFQFKKFIVHQEHTSMKVCTDACLFGAWAIQDASLQNASTILDIGTGTGLLSLMCAQKNTIAKITAVEIEPGAANEARSNIDLSKWKDRLEVINCSIQDFADKHNRKFESIISNPPFFETDLNSPDDNKNLASHSAALPWNEFAAVVANLLETNGNFYVIIPSIRAYTMQKHMEANTLQLVEETTVFNKEKQLPFRSFLKFTNSAEKITTIKRGKLFIKQADNTYTEQFKDLLRDYYLQF